jgi:hypothetical protein
VIVKPETYKKLIAVHKGKIVKIPNMILRKQSPSEKQNKNLTKNSVCIVCNFRFLEKSMEWSSKIKAICHPFRDCSIFPRGIKKYLFSESDFCDKLITPVCTIMNKWDREKYDFVYFTLNSREGTRSKGIYTLPLLDCVAGNLNLKGLVIDYSKRETAKHKGTIYDDALVKIRKKIKKLKNLTVIKGHFSADEVCAIMLSVKFIFLPSDADASPRMIVEPLVRNKPIVVSSAIYGGWKYINDRNGRFFNAPTIENFMEYRYNSEQIESLTRAMREVMLIDSSNISRDFYEKWGFKNSVKRMANIVYYISGKKYKAVAFREWEFALKKIAKKEKWI